MKKLLYVLAAVGLFVACQPEEIQTAFEVDPAKAVITVSFVDVNTGKAPETDPVVLMADGSVVENPYVILGNKALTERTVTFTAKYQDIISDPYTVPVPAVKAGSVVNINITIVVGKPNVEKTIELVEGNPGDVIVYGPYYFQPEGHELVFHDDMMWAKNLTEFMLTGTVTYDSYTGCERDDFEVYNDVYAAQVEAKSYLYDFGLFAEPMKAEIKVSAWSYYTAYTEVYAVPGYYEVYAEYAGKKECVGKVTIYGYYTRFEYEEIANPEGHGHYEYGHGHAHDHGGSDNAGGGIVVAE